jgi:SAM-dependent methyltransferase
MDVIEHIKDDKAALRAIHSLLKPGGRFFVTVPACMFLWSKFDELGEFPHYRRYSYNSLKTLLEANGFKKKYLSYYNFFLFPIAYIVRKFFSNNASEQLEPSQGRIHSFFEKILSSERFILPYLSFPIGVSLIGVFEKEE